MAPVKRVIDEIIRQAIEEGKFDNLPGQGKPLELEDNPHVDRDQRLAYGLLKQNGFAPEWIEKRQAIELKIQTARHALQQSWEWYTGGSKEGYTQEMRDSQWERAQQRFRSEVDAVNAEVRQFNLNYPSPRFYLLPVEAEKEMEVLKASRGE